MLDASQFRNSSRYFDLLIQNEAAIIYYTSIVLWADGVLIKGAEVCCFVLGARAEKVENFWIPRNSALFNDWFQWKYFGGDRPAWIQDHFSRNLLYNDRFEKISDIVF